MAEIRLTGVDKIYPGGTHAVHGVDLHIADGEFMIMVGPSGCAKSTILRMIAGLETPSGGTIEIGGRVVNDVAPKDRDIAMVFQSYALYPHMTVRENMAFGLRLRKMPPVEIDQRVNEAARILGLEHLLDRLPKAMSGGQRQRVAMGRAIVREPQAFLMDEPLSNLDAKLRVQMRTEIAKLHQRLNTTTVYVTHDQVEAMTLGQRICILRSGVVQQVDTPFQVYQNPANVFVGGFMGSPGMNFMNGQLVLQHGTPWLQLGGSLLPLPASVTSRLLTGHDLHGRSVIVGIRPEHLALGAPSDSDVLPVRVELTEAMGSELYAYFSADVSTPDLTALSDTQATADTFVARLAAGVELRGGEQITLRPDMDEVHLFDPQSMQTLLAPVSETEVRARQGGLTLVTSAPTARSMVQPEAVPVVTGTLGDVADPSVIAAVFDAPIAAPVAVEPLEPVLAVGASHAPVMQAGESSGGTSHPRPSFASTIASGLGGGDRASIPAPFGGRGPRPGTQLDLAAPVGPGSDDDAPQPDAPLESPAAAATPAPAEAPAPRHGFAPRRIGADTSPATEPPRTSSDARTDAIADVPTPTLQVDDESLDAAIEQLETPVEHPTTSTNQAPTSFRAALARVRAATSEPAAPVQARPSILPPRVSLRPTEPSSPPGAFDAARWKISMDPSGDPEKK